MIYTWKITGLKRKNSNDAKNIIVQTYWKKIGTDQYGNTGEFSGATPFDVKEVDQNNFISYEDLTEETVIEWIKSIVVGDYEQHVNAQIQKQIDEKTNPEVEDREEFPWGKNPDIDIDAPSNE
jgi:hypothetical protein